MEPVQIANTINEKFPGEVLGITEYRGQVSVHIKKEKVFEICRWLHDDPSMDFDYLADVCGMDYLGRKVPRFEVVYQLYSIKHAHRLRLKAQVPEDDTSIASVVPIWAGANWHERECYDLFGITFKGHPDLRRILLPEDWEGFPLRKDYPVQGPELEEDWRGYKEVLEKSEKLREFGWEK